MYGAGLPKSAALRVDCRCACRIPSLGLSTRCPRTSPDNFQARQRRVHRIGRYDDNPGPTVNVPISFFERAAIERCAAVSEIADANTYEMATFALTRALATVARPADETRLLRAEPCTSISRSRSSRLRPKGGAHQKGNSMFTIIGRRFGVAVAAATALALLSSCSFSLGTGGESQSSGSPGGVRFPETFSQRPFRSRPSRINQVN